ncbi:MAG: type II toxin-antitoxin system RelE/ParE family toxin [Anaerolineae bacterium]|nr:type II toxin-antitoxin system RelE/ParE family toxin [Anaerolineae bacterium]
MNKVTIELTDRLRKDYQNLPTAIQKKFKKQLRFLAENPRHPSLNMHRIRGTHNYWEFYIDQSYRCIFRYENNVYYLIAAGPHKVVDEFAKK